jgi:hypothetical protein
MHTARGGGKLFRRLLVVIGLMYTGAIKALIFQHQLLLSSLRAIPQVLLLHQWARKPQSEHSIHDW